jgi:hypothetical protein
MKETPENISKLKDNEVFVFGSNASGFHGAGAAGLACRGESRNTWRYDKWFLKAKNSTKGSVERIGKWAIYGEAHGFQKGKEGKSYAIETIKRAGSKRSTSLEFIYEQLEVLMDFARENPQYEFLITKIGSSLAGYTLEEIKSCFQKLKEIPSNVSLPKEYI